MWGQWGSAAGDLLLGACCRGCGRPAWAICLGCRTALSNTSPWTVTPDPCPVGFPTTAAAGPYDPIVRSLILAHKEDQAWTLTPILGQRLAVAIAHLLGSQGESERRRPQGDAQRRRPLVLVPVPSAGSAVRERGLDTAAALARSAARRLRSSGPVQVTRALRQRRAVRDQAGLGAHDRRANLYGGLRVVRQLERNAMVVVVDDVVTTGSSLTEAARALDSAGIVITGAATVAATVRRRPSTSSRPHPPR